MNLLEFKTISQDGRTASVLVNPDRVCYIVPIVVPGELSGPTGDKMGKTLCALDFGGTMLPVDCTREEAVRRLLHLSPEEFLKWKKENMSVLKDTEDMKDTK